MASDISQSTLNLTSEEKRVYGQLFQQADSERLGVVPGDVAVTFFERTRLDSAVLAQIWQIADDQNRGLLTPAGFSVALRLIGHCQAGRQPTADLSKQPGPLPKFDTPGAPAASIGTPTAAPASPINPQTTGPIRVPPLLPEKVAEFTTLFDKAGAQGGWLPGGAAKQMFERAGLPNETLGKIWTLADSEQRGGLNITEFIVAMHLITSVKAGTLRAVPTTLPAGLFEAAARRPTQPPVARAVQAQFTGQSAQRAQSPLSRSAAPTAAPLSAQSTGDNFQQDWLVSSADKARFDSLFATIDKNRVGYINGEQAVQFFSTSGLPEDLLASIWDLADIRSEGQLNRDEFAVAMYLIREQRSKRDGRGTVPSALPPRLIPPSMRQRSIPPSQPTAPAFDNAANASQRAKSAADDLFGLDVLSDHSDSQTPAAPSPASPKRAPTGAFISPQSTAAVPQTGGLFKPFVPSSSFGQGLAQQNTGGSVQSNQPTQRAFARPAVDNDDLLGDNDPEISSKLTNESTELANMSNQIGSLRTQMSEIQNKKVASENEATSSSAQKRELEVRLSQFRSQYEQEIREVKAIEERLNASRADTKKAQQEMAMVEGAHQDLQTQHQKLTSAFQADQAENASLKERISAANAQTAQLRPLLEKLKADARQLKGLVAINKKQLSTAEAEMDRMNSERTETESENERLQQDITASAEAARQAEEAAKQADISRQSEVAKHAELLKQADAMRQAAAAKKAEAAKQAEALRQAEAVRQAEAAKQAEALREAEAAEGAEAARQAEALRQSETTRQEATSTQATRSASPVASPAASIASQNTNPFFRGAGVMSPSIFQDDSASHAPNAFDSFFGPTPTSHSPGLPPPPPINFGSETPRDLTNATSTGSPTDIPTFPEPPAPPESRQIPSSALPLHVSAMRNGSFTSSVRAQPPLSHMGDSDIATPTMFAGTPTESVAADREHASPAIESRSAIDEAAASGFASSATKDIDDSDNAESFKDVRETIPGAFPTDSYVSTPDTDESAKAAETFGSGQPTARSAATGAVGSASEFPPIREFDASDDDDSDSDDEPTGKASAHDDNLTSTSQAPASGTLGVPAARIGDSTEALPTPSKQMSPPSYDETVPQAQGSDREPNQFPREFDGLLPSREIAQSPPREVPQSPPQNLLAGSGSLAAATSSAEIAKAAPVDDFDSAFDDLSEAKDEDEHDAFALSGRQRGDFDFNPVFDSLGPSQSSATTANHNKTSSFDSAFGSVAAPGSTAQFYGSRDAATGSHGQGSATGGNHDWDDLFSGLDNSAPAANGAKDPFDLDEPSRPTQATATSTFDSFAAAPSTSSRNLSAFPQGSGLRPGLPGRAISTGTEHDDPILKSLTNIGFPRAQALAALEKFDYNTDLATEYLTKQ